MRQIDTSSLHGSRLRSTIAIQVAANMIRQIALEVEAAKVIARQLPRAAALKTMNSCMVAHPGRLLCQHMQQRLRNQGAFHESSHVSEECMSDHQRSRRLLPGNLHIKLLLPKGSAVVRNDACFSSFCRPMRGTSALVVLTDSSRSLSVDCAEVVSRQFSIDAAVNVQPSIALPAVSMTRKSPAAAV
jgi:hypothetical protein